MGKNIKKNNENFIDSAFLNNQTYLHYLEIFQKLATSIFEWHNLPNSMDERYLELSLYRYGQASILKDKDYGFINTNCSTNGTINIYGIPTALNCYSYDYQENRKVYTGLLDNINQEFSHCILVMNNNFRLPTFTSLQLYAYRLYDVQRTIDTNITNQKFPLLLLCDDKQKLTLKNVYQAYNGNQPVIFGDKSLLNDNNITALQTETPYLADKLQEYKEKIFNEALTFLGINNIIIEKHERLINQEAESNNELINLNLQNYLIPRQHACDQFNELFKLPDDKKLSVRVRSDLDNIIKTANSSINDYIEGDNIG